MRAIGAACICVLLLSSCGGQNPAGGQPHPDGWRAEAQGKSTAWVDPKDPRQRYAVASNPNQTATLGQMGARVTIDTLLTHKGAKLLKTTPYPGCPGEAGLQSFLTAKADQVLRIAYTQWSGKAVTAVYIRPGSLPDDPAAVNALTRAVCSAVSGAPTLPPAGP